jgi:hypothetical protein
MPARGVEPAGQGAGGDAGGEHLPALRQPCVRHDRNGGV